MSIVISELYYYPVKSCAGLRLDTAEIGARGIKYDRQWMVVDDNGEFLTQRELPRMSLIKPAINGDGFLRLNAPEMPELTVSLSSDGEISSVKVWNDTCEGVDQGAESANWFSQYLGGPCRLVKIAPNYVRQVDQNYAQRETDQVGFADGFPFLLIGEASLADLNSRLADPLPMNRFRPNIVVKGSQAFAEDDWKRVSINGIEFDVVKPCARCVITTVNQDTGVAGSEPLKTLAGFRRVNNKLLFGQNLTHMSKGTISVGDAIKLIS